ncbi:MAG: hypothetical protein KAJ19_23175 [Gammaproteobacteria bacterium]|nr:hypothetical protein [Gammaproteobacteria bacterium]
MSHIRCPMCGKDSAFSTFDPENLDVDIYIRQVTGLGRGRGFSPGPDESVFGDDHYTPKVMDKCMELLKAGIEKGSVTWREIARQLKMGVPKQGTEDVIPYEDVLKALLKQNNALQTKTTSLERQISTARSGVSLFEHEQLRERYEKLESNVRAKKKTDEVLRFLHSVLDSEIAFEGDDWILEIYEYDPLIYAYLCKELYTMSKEERDLLQSRIDSEYVEFYNIFWIFKGKPTITSVADRLIKEPGKFYYRLYDLPFPNHLLGV